MTMPKLTVTNYPEMLRKLSTGMFFVVIACVWLARKHLPGFDGVFGSLDVTVPSVPVLGKISVPFATFLAAFLVAGLTESIKLHDRVSDVLRLRREFDIYVILLPMALLTGTTLTVVQLEKLPFARKQLMGQVFYAYASSTKPVIDSHTITQALTAWSWYWMCVETTTALLVTALILATAGSFMWGAALVTMCLLLLLMVRVFHFDCVKYATSQVQQILSDTGRRSSIAAIFNAL